MVFLVCVLPVTAVDQENMDYDLQALADSSIEMICNEADTSQMTYKNIEEFIRRARDVYPSVSDLDLAKFILTYTQQGYENLPDDIILRALDSKEVANVREYFEVDENGNQSSISKQKLQSVLVNEALQSQKAVSPTAWTSPNGYLEIETNYTKTHQSGLNNYYTISARARWLKMPICFFEDVLAIGHAAVYDDSVKPFGYRYQTNSCCGNEVRFNDSTTFPHSSLSLDYPDINGAVLRFKLYSPYSAQCQVKKIAHLKYAHSISSYITYGIISHGTAPFNIRSAYGHKELAVGSVDVSFSVIGQDVSIGFSVGGYVKSYNAEPLTIRP